MTSKRNQHGCRTQEKRQDVINEIETLITDQGLRYTYRNGSVTIHTPEGDRSFLWTLHTGIKETATWLKDRARGVTRIGAYEAMDNQLKLQYTSAYGPYVAGIFAIGESIAVPGTSGEIIWSYQSGKEIKYCIDDHSGMPTEVYASEVHGRVAPWN